MEGFVHMVKKYISSIVLAMMLCGVTVQSFAQEDFVNIDSISASNGTIMIEATNKGENDAELTMTVIGEENKIYSVRQESVKAKEKHLFKFVIPSDEDGWLKAGKYSVKVQNNGEGQEGRDEKSFACAGHAPVEEFVLGLQAAAKTVTDRTKAYEKLLPVIEQGASEGVFFSIGFDYEAFNAEGESFKKDAACVLYENINDTLTSDNLAEVFDGATGLTFYNTGNKAKGVEMLKPEFGGNEIDPLRLNGALTIMDNSFETTEEFKKAFKTAYGLTLLSYATVNEMESVLEKYADETGECTDIIGEIKNLDSTKKYLVYKAIVLKLDSENVRDSERLESILKEAYNDVKSTSGTGGGTGGTVGNSSSVKSPSGFGTAVSGTAENNGKGSINIEEFSDMPTQHWAAEAVKGLVKAGAVNGNGANKFEPERSVNREEFVKMLVILCGFDNSENKQIFVDVSESDWYAPYVCAAVNNGVVTGIGDETFGAGRSISRQDMAVMTMRAIEAKGIKLAKNKEYEGFEDEILIADYAENAVITLFEAGIINGKENKIFDPAGTATRAEAAMILYSAFVNR